MAKKTRKISKKNSTKPAKKKVVASKEAKANVAATTKPKKRLQIFKPILFISIGLAIATAVAVPVTLKAAGYFEPVPQPPQPEHYEWPSDLPGYEPGELAYSNTSEYTIKAYSVPSELEDITTVYYSLNNSAFQKSQTFKMPLLVGDGYSTKIKLTAPNYDDKVIEGGKLSIVGDDAPEEVKECFPIVAIDDKYSQGFIRWTGIPISPYKVDELAKDIFPDAITSDVTYFNNIEPEKTLTEISDVGSYTAKASVFIPSYSYTFDVSKVFTIKEAEWPDAITYNAGTATYSSNGNYSVPAYEPTKDGFDDGTKVMQYGLEEIGGSTPYSSDTNNFVGVNLQYNHFYNVNILLYNKNYTPTHTLYYKDSHFKAGCNHTLKVDTKAEHETDADKNYALSTAKLNVVKANLEPLNENDLVVKKGVQPSSVTFKYGENKRAWDEFYPTAVAGQSYDVYIELEFDNYVPLEVKSDTQLKVRADVDDYAIKAIHLTQTIDNPIPLTKDDIEVKEGAAAIQDTPQFKYGPSESTDFPTTAGSYEVKAIFTAGGGTVTIHGLLNINRATEWPTKMAFPETQTPYVASGKYNFKGITDAPAGSVVTYECINGWSQESVPITTTTISFTDTNLRAGKYALTAIVSNPNWLKHKTLNSFITITEGESGVSIKMPDPVIDAQCGTSINPAYTLVYGGPATSDDVVDNLKWYKKSGDTWNEIDGTMPTTVTVADIGTYSIGGTVTFDGKYQDLPKIEPGKYIWTMSAKTDDGTFTCDQSCSISIGSPAFEVYEGIKDTDCSTSFTYIINANSGYNFDLQKYEAENYITITGCGSECYSILGNVTSSTSLMAMIHFNGSVRGNIEITCSTTPH